MDADSVSAVKTPAAIADSRERAGKFPLKLFRPFPSLSDPRAT